MTASKSAAAIEQLLRHPSIWRAAAGSPGPQTAHLATGWPVLDAALPGGGWPQGVLIEVLSEHRGIGEMALLMPALANLTDAGRWLAWVAPPSLPYAPALAARGIDLGRVLVVTPDTPEEVFWAARQLAAAEQCGAVLLWAAHVEERQLRRLQLAAESAGTLAVLFRPAAQAARSSPAGLRLRLLPGPRGPQVQVLKCRGRLPGRHLKVG